MFYQKHIFFCTNQKEEGKKCCAQGDALAMWQYAREQCKELGLLAHNNVRVSKAGCLGRCAQGPCAVIYPEGRWYTYQTTKDIDAIIAEELIADQPVERLMLSESAIK
jgi:(2Fe-2S) ferredoxin